ncbi:MAG: ATP-binding protein [Candidatus Thermoplasmatota archaeon]|nr:ATP-binding protein [Candidatus Thermoplasmatota archaeon]
MILKDTLRNIVIEQRTELESYEYGTERDDLQRIPIELLFAVIITGIRRSGKSTLLHQLLKKLPNFYYLNFEDTRLISFEPSDFVKLDQVFNEEFGSSEFYILDEVQNVKGWEIFVRSRLDRHKKLFITGSNASLLSKELGTRLTGRHINIEIFPFSFQEALRFMGQDPSHKSFETYFYKGGFPEYLKYNNLEILRELLLDILYRDIISRYNIRETRALQEMTLYLLTNIGKEFSYNSLKKMFGFGSVNTPISFISYLEDSYLLFTISKFDYSLKKQLVNAKKVYSVDNAMSIANSASFTSDKGRMLENIVFLALLRTYREIYYFREKGECDFLVKVDGVLKIAIQVTYELNEDNKRRELEGLTEAMEKLGIEEGFILTYGQEDELIFEGRTIKIKPAWKWMYYTK